jgi:zinc protease
MLDRLVAPPIQKILSIQLPVAEVTALPNGARLHILYNASQPVIKLEIVFKAGRWYEPVSALSYFTSKLLLEGTAKYSAQQIADIIGFYGASLECNQGFDRATLTLYTLSKHLENIIPVIQDIISQPTFPESEFKLLKTRTLQNVAIEKQRNAYLATKRLTESIYGPKQPYIAGLDETEIENVTLDQIKDFFLTNFSLAESEIFVSGAIEPDTSQILLTALNKTPAGLKILDIPPSANVYQKQVHYLEREDQIQTTIRIGCPWPLMHDENFSQLSLLNKILGGYFGSRLMKNIREEKGFTYGIFSTVSAKEHATLFYIGTDVNYQNSGRTIEEIIKEITLLQNDLVPEEELDTVKNYTIGKFINDSSNIFDQVDKYKSLVLHNLPINYYSDYLNHIANAEARHLQELAQIYLNPASLTQVLVGKNTRG